MALTLYLLAHTHAPARAQIPPPPEKPSGKAKVEPRLYVETRTHELGKILEGEVVDVSWKIENRGNADLVIDRASAACGCTVVNLRDEDKIVKAGAALDLKVTFNSTSRFGEQNKEVVVFSNDPIEPELKLFFRSTVDQLFNADPLNVMNVRVLRRGQSAQKPLELLPAPGRGELTVTKIDVEPSAPFEATVEPFEKGGLKGAKVQITVLESAAVGPLGGTMTIKLRVGDIERERLYSVRGEIVGDLTWLPKVIDATRQPSLTGKYLTPVTISSTDQRPFKILEASAGASLVVAVSPGQNPKPETEYAIQVAINEFAPPGPFGTWLRIVTDSLDQPVVEIPVFGIIAPKVDIEPGTVFLRSDGTEAGIRRRVRIKTADTSDLTVSSVECDSPAVTIEVDTRSTSNYQHLAFLDVRLTGALPSGTHHAKITVLTNVAGAERLEIPVRILSP